MIDYRDTVFLPATPFPMRGDLPKREPEILARWERTDLWQRTCDATAGRPSFVLHDGPIYSNGHLHIGHALNRILKDVVMRAHRMAGFDAGYVPGWDCHGLPIEWKVEEEYRRTGRDKDAVPVLGFRAECRAYSQGWLDIQTAEFKRLGVTGDWAGRYATMDYPAEAAIAGEIGKFLLNGALYRGLRPVMWSPVEKTALARGRDRVSRPSQRHRLGAVPDYDRPAHRHRRADLDHHALDHARQPRLGRRGRDRPTRRSGTSTAWPRGRWHGPAKPCWWHSTWSARCARRPGSRPTTCCRWCTVPAWTASWSRMPCAVATSSEGDYDDDRPIVLGRLRERRRSKAPAWSTTAPGARRPRTTQTVPRATTSPTLSRSSTPAGKYCRRGAELARRRARLQGGNGPRSSRGSARRATGCWRTSY